MCLSAYAAWNSLHYNVIVCRDGRDCYGFFSPVAILPDTNEFHRCAVSDSASINWNDLPYDIRTCDSVNSFKRKLKAHLFNIAYAA